MKAPLPEPRTRWLVVGKTGSGKSTYVKEQLRGWLARGVRVVALDPCDEYSQQGRETGLVRLGPLKKRVTAAQLAADPSLLLERRLSLAVVPGGGPPTWARAFVMLARMARHAGRVLLVADEVGTWTDRGLHADCHRAGAELVSLSTNGRHAGIALALIAQRASQIPAGARAQATSWSVFRQDEPADLEALADRLGRDAAEQVRHLPLGEHHEWRDDTPQRKTPPALRAV